MYCVSVFYVLQFFCFLSVKKELNSSPDCMKMYDMRTICHKIPDFGPPKKLELVKV